MGLRVTRRGKILPWRTDFTTSLYGIKGRLVSAGLGNLPIALSKALLVKVVPAVLYGCEIWGIHWLAAVVTGEQSPYKHPRLDLVISFLKHYFGLP